MISRIPQKLSKDSFPISLWKNMAQLPNSLWRIVSKAVMIPAPDSGLWFDQQPLPPLSSGKQQLQQHQPDSGEMATFETKLSMLDTDLYTPFMMHIEGYRLNEIAQYLVLSENQVAYLISQAKDLLKAHADLKVD